jgi:hypothetical protein
MKALVLSLLVLAFVGSATAATRMVLFEEWTNTA